MFDVAHPLSAAFRIRETDVTSMNEKEFVFRGTKKQVAYTLSSC